MAPRPRTPRVIPTCREEGKRENFPQERTTRTTVKAVARMRVANIIGNNDGWLLSLLSRDSSTDGWGAGALGSANYLPVFEVEESTSRRSSREDSSHRNMESSAGIALAIRSEPDSLSVTDFRASGARFSDRLSCVCAASALEPTSYIRLRVQK